MVWGKNSADEWKVVARLENQKWVDKVHFVKGGELLIAHSRPNRTTSNTGGGQSNPKARDGYSAVWGYKRGQCLVGLKQRVNKNVDACLTSSSTRVGLSLF